MIRVFATLSLIAFVLLQPYAAGAMPCHRHTSPTSAEVGHKNVGPGVVTYSIGQHGKEPFTRTLVLESCLTGEMLTARVATGKLNVATGASISTFDVTEDAEALVADALASEAVETFGDLASGLKALGARVVRVKSEKESCACQKWYPDMRGTKTHFTWVEDR